MTDSQKKIKRILDFLISLTCICIGFIPILFLFFIASIDTRSFGLFKQNRVGKDAKIFKIFKIKTYNKNKETTKLGVFLRKSKLNELPQLFNVLKGEMSLVGPRPDFLEYAEKLQGKNRLILSIKPGITGPATLRFSNEEFILKNQLNPEKYYTEVIWPEKIRLNLEYIKSYNVVMDIDLMIKTVFILLFKR